MTHPSVDLLWQRYRAIDPTAPADLPVAHYFCDNERDADICIALVLAGRKRATASSLVEYEMAGEPPPTAGVFVIVTNWAGEAKAVTRTHTVTIKRFGDVGEDFAQLEGEGDGSLTWWREAHQEYWQQALAGTPHVVDEDLQIVCEEFDVVLVA
ncbi:ASCH domain-containing protein [Sphingomonas sp. ERG5]|uniref:ASCH domain-containing protein n=1 Tax=Sphingomonas sp. ERG5 TaxID=1381597 RepID=UPI00054C3DD0|nr:ASCH domain-containing protein [Sphingomonas sp. ERG5]